MYILILPIDVSSLTAKSEALDSLRFLIHCAAFFLLMLSLYINRCCRICLHFESLVLLSVLQFYTPKCKGIWIKVSVVLGAVDEP